MLLYKRTISPFQVILTKPTNASSTLLPHHLILLFILLAFLAGGGGGVPNAQFFFTISLDWAAVQLCFSCMCKSGDKNLKTGNKVNRVEQFSTVKLFLMF